MESTLPLVECFHSIQGEGAHTGRSAFFIRLGSCKVGCNWCDTKESWNANNHPQITINKLCKATINAWTNGAAFLVITGGEPLHHNLSPLCDAIRDQARLTGSPPIAIHVETSGVDAISGDPNWITLSPKRHAPPKIQLLAACHELKVVIHDPEDLLFAEAMAKAAIREKNSPLLFLQPGWGSSQGHNLALEHVKANSQWRLSMQTHKWLAIL